MADVEQIYQCPICEFRYHDEATAKRGETWCREHKSCHLEIIKESLENQQTKETP